MLNFKRIELEDKPVIDQMLEGNNYRASECCFSNLWGWAHKFNTQYTVWNGFLIIKFTNVEGGCSYLKPFGDGNLNEAISLMKQDCDNPEGFQMWGVTPNMLQSIEEAMPGVFSVTPVRSGFDYIYLTDKLINLQGKQLQSKRNHINRFKKENDWKYISLNEQPEAIKECQRMLKEWIDQYIEEDESLELDYITTSGFLQNFDALALRGGAICVNSQVQAFTLGTKLTDDTFIVHAEKAFTNLHGAYTIMNQQFVEHEAKQYKYVNREEDMGLHSLRQAKLSYRPDILLEKNILKYKK